MSTKTNNRNADFPINPANEGEITLSDHDRIISGAESHGIIAVKYLS